MDMPTKAERLSDAMAAVSRGEVDVFGEMLLSDDVVWHWPGRSSVAGDYRGRDAALDLIRGFGQLTQGRLRVEPIDILEGGDYLMAFTHVTAEQEGRQLDVTMADAMRFGPDGRVVEYWTLSNDQAAVDAFIG
jgi:ketosteroid isomerase-like protein